MQIKIITIPNDETTSKMSNVERLALLQDRVNTFLADITLQHGEIYSVNIIINGGPIVIPGAPSNSLVMERGGMSLTVTYVEGPPIAIVKYFPV